MALGGQYVSRNALSQMNYRDLEDEQDQYLEYGLEADDFEKMMMLQEDEESQQEYLQLNRHKSAFEKVRFADSASYISKSNQKTDLRKKKSPTVNFREDLNIEAKQATHLTPQQDTKHLLSQDDEFLIPISQTQFDGTSREHDKIESNINR